MFTYRSLYLLIDYLSKYLLPTHINFNLSTLHLTTYLPVFLTTSCPTYLYTFLPFYLSICTCLPVYLYLSTCFFVYSPAWLLANFQFQSSSLLDYLAMWTLLVIWLSIFLDVYKSTTIIWNDHFRSINVNSLTFFLAILKLLNLLLQNEINLFTSKP